VLRMLQALSCCAAASGAVKHNRSSMQMRLPFKANHSHAVSSSGIVCCMSASGCCRLPALGHASPGRGGVVDIVFSYCSCWLPVLCHGHLCIAQRPLCVLTCFAFFARMKCCCTKHSVAVSLMALTMPYSNTVVCSSTVRCC
jgi:hypothetical protein